MIEKKDEEEAKIKEKLKEEQLEEMKERVRVRKSSLVLSAKEEEVIKSAPAKSI